MGSISGRENSEREIQSENTSVIQKPQKKIKPRDADRGRKTDIQATVYELSVFYLGMHVYMFIYTITINESRGYEVEGEQGEVYGRERY